MMMNIIRTATTTERKKRKRREKRHRKRREQNTLIDRQRASQKRCFDSAAVGPRGGPGRLRRLAGKSPSEHRGSDAAAPD